MRPAPAVSIEIPVDRRWRAAVALLHGCAAAAAVSALWSGATAPALLAAAVAAALSWHRWRVDHGRLAWDGAQWRLDGEPGQMQVRLDLDRWLLLRLHMAGGRRAWLAVARSAAPAHWHALRAAVYSPRIALDRDGGDPSSA